MFGYLVPSRWYLLESGVNFRNWRLIGEKWVIRSCPWGCISQSCCPGHPLSPDCRWKVTSGLKFLFVRPFPPWRTASKGWTVRFLLPSSCFSQKFLSQQWKKSQGRQVKMVGWIALVVTWIINHLQELVSVLVKDNWKGALNSYVQLFANWGETET